MFSWLLRRTHMYVALFLFPWMLMYASSTLVMNHRALFSSAESPPAFETERELRYDGVVSPDAPPRAVSEQLLESLGLAGAHTVTKRRDGSYVINRADLVAPRRITYTPTTANVIIERLPFRANTFLERFHRRRGYATGYALDNAWAVTVDAAIGAMIFWVLSGLWMWWEMKATRRWGLVALAGGVAMFSLYLAAI